MSELNFWFQCRGFDIGSQQQESRSVGDGTQKKVARLAAGEGQQNRFRLAAKNQHKKKLNIQQCRFCVKHHFTFA